MRETGRLLAKHDRKKLAPLGAGQVLSVLPDMPFNPEPYIPFGRCSLLERWPHLGGGGNLFPTAAAGNDGATKKGKIDPTSMPHFLADHHLGGLTMTAIPSAFIMEAA